MKFDRSNAHTLAVYFVDDKAWEFAYRESALALTSEDVEVVGVIARGNTAPGARRAAM